MVKNALDFGKRLVCILVMAFLIFAAMIPCLFLGPPKTMVGFCISMTWFLFASVVTCSSFGLLIVRWWKFEF